LWNIFSKEILKNIFLKNICFNIFLKRIFDSNIYVSRRKIFFQWIFLFVKYIFKRDFGKYIFWRIFVSIYFWKEYLIQICLAYDEKVNALDGYIWMTCTLVLFTNSIVLDWVFRVSTCALFVSLSLYHLDALRMTFCWVVMYQNHRLIKE